MVSTEPVDLVAFGPFRLHRAHRRLFCGAEEVQLGGRAMEMLVTLASKKGELGPQRSMVPELLRLRAVKERSIGRDDESLSTLRQSLIAAEGNGAWAWRIRCATDLALLLRDRMQIDDARSVLEPLYRQFIDGFDTPDLKRARELLTELQGSRSFRARGEVPGGSPTIH